MLISGFGGHIVVLQESARVCGKQTLKCWDDGNQVVDLLSNDLGGGGVHSSVFLALP